MEFAMREWLTVIIVLLIAGVLLDGWRRMRQSKQDSIRMSLSMHTGVEKEDLEGYGSELPSGGARVVSQRDETEARQFHQALQDNFVQSKTTAGAKTLSDREPEQVALDLDSEVPMLMESVEENGIDQDLAASLMSNLEAGDKPAEPESKIDAEYGLSQPRVVGRKPSQEEQVESAPSAFSAEFDTVEPSADVLEAATEIASESSAQASTCSDEPKERKEPTFDEASAFDDQLGLGQSRVVTRQVETAPSDAAIDNVVDDASIKQEPVIEARKAPAADTPAVSEEEQEVLIINIMAPKDYVFAGQALLDTVLEADMRFGDMDIFHYHRDSDGEGPVLFSLVNMVKPGTFDLATMPEFTTPGVSLFLTLPLPSDSLKAFNTMADAAKLLVQRLGGEMKDENRSVMTGQTLEHCRQRISEFERKRRLK